MCRRFPVSEYALGLPKHQGDFQSSRLVPCPETAASTSHCLPVQVTFWVQVLLQAKSEWRKTGVTSSGQSAGKQASWEGGSFVLLSQYPFKHQRQAWTPQGSIAHWGYYIRAKTEKAMFRNIPVISSSSQAWGVAAKNYMTDRYTE